MTEPANILGIESSCDEATTLLSTFRPSATTAQAVSSQLDSIPSMLAGPVIRRLQYADG